MELVIANEAIYVILIIYSFLLGSVMFTLEKIFNKISSLIENRRSKYHRDQIRQLKEIRNNTMEYCFARFNQPQRQQHDEVQQFGERILRVRPINFQQPQQVVIRSKILQRRRIVPVPGILMRMDSGIDMSEVDNE